MMKTRVSSVPTGIAERCAACHVSVGARWRGDVHGTTAVAQAQGAPLVRGHAAATQQRALLAEGRSLVKRTQADWNRGRYPDDPTRDLDGKPGVWGDAIIPNLLLALSRLGG